MNIYVNRYMYSNMFCQVFFGLHPWYNIFIQYFIRVAIDFSFFYASVLPVSLKYKLLRRGEAIRIPTLYQHSECTVKWDEEIGKGQELDRVFSVLCYFSWAHADGCLRMGTVFCLRFANNVDLEGRTKKVINEHSNGRKWFKRKPCVAYRNIFKT